jgi:UDP:flavonoid glycosyltransferase YjiC (YdhE family)
MKPITFLASGSIGDVDPLMALASGLAEEGYPIRFACPSLYREAVESAGWQYDVALEQGDPRKVQQDDYEKRTAKPTAFFARYLRGVGPSRAALRAQLEAIRGSSLLICNTVTGAAYHAAESLRVPCMMVYYSPMYATRHFPAPIGPQGIRLGPVYNLGTHWLAQQMFWQYEKPWINDWREEDLGLSKVSFRELRKKQKTTLVRAFAFSKRLAPEVTDWPENNRIPGFFSPRRKGNFEPDPSLVQFLEGQRPPVFIGFGSVRSPEVNRVLGELRSALAATGERGIFVGGWGTSEMRDLDSRFFFTNYVPYDWLLPRVSLAIHAAGCGTTAEVLKAGIPSIPIPFAGEQKFWAERLRWAGVALAAVGARDVTAARMTDLIRRSLQAESLRNRARQLQEEIRQEDGVRETVRIVKELLSREKDSSAACRLERQAAEL